MDEMIQHEITKHINKTPFSVICDEVTDDVANRQIFSLRMHPIFEVLQHGQLA